VPRALVPLLHRPLECCGGAARQGLHQTQQVVPVLSHGGPVPLHDHGRRGLGSGLHRTGGRAKRGLGRGEVGRGCGALRGEFVVESSSCAGSQSELVHGQGFETC
jgi:hypothetical protein